MNKVGPNHTIPTISIIIVNLNCLQDTRELIFDLDRQTFTDYDVTLYDQGSIEDGTELFLNAVSSRDNYRVVQNGQNLPLNHLWNEFVEKYATGEYISFLNNDIRIPSNYLEDTYNVLAKDARVGIAVHATNNRDFTSASRPTRHMLENKDVKQGWEFTLHRSSWSPIPTELKFYCGDDFIYNHIKGINKKVGVITSSPVIHKLSQTRKSMSKVDADAMRTQAMSDIETYKKLGYKHVWNNIPHLSRIEPEIKSISEISFNPNLCKFKEYETRLNEHLNDIKSVGGIIVDIGVRDIQTFKSLHEATLKFDKTLMGINFNNVTGVISTNYKNPTLNLINSDSVIKNSPKVPTILNNDVNNVMDGIDGPISFAFMGIFDSVRLRVILADIWDHMAPGGTIFFPHYFYDLAPDVKGVIDEFISDRVGKIIRSKQRTSRGTRDTYLVVKCYPAPLQVKARTKPLTVVSVLKMHSKVATNKCSYNETYVNKLAAAVKRNSTVDYKFVCLTDGNPKLIDYSVVDEVIPLEFGLNGWWSKIELFRPELFIDSQVLYFDLDTLITDNIDDIMNYGGDFMALRDLNTLVHVGSGILGWDPSKTRHIFYKVMRKVISGENLVRSFPGGDQEAIERTIEIGIDWVGDMFLNKIHSFTDKCYDGKVTMIPEGTSIVFFHGTPKMEDLPNDPVIQEHWRLP